MVEEPTGGMGFHWELPAYLHRFRPVRSKCADNPLKGNNSRISSSKSYMLTMPTFKYKGLFKLKINLIRPYKNFISFQLNHKKDSKIS
jgi:hypothetical protein